MKGKHLAAVIIITMWVLSFFKSDYTLPELSIWGVINFVLSIIILSVIITEIVYYLYNNWNKKIF